MSEPKKLFTCQCGSQLFTLERQTFANGTNHVAAFCATCQKHLQFIPQGPPKPVYNSGPVTAMPFGKHKGRKITELPGDYIRWAVANLEAPDIKAALEEELRRRSG